MALRPILCAPRVLAPLALLCGCAFEIAELDQTPPTPPTNLEVVGLTETQVVLQWDASTDDVVVSHYLVQRDGVEIANVPSPGHTDDTVIPTHHYRYAVVAVDGAGNVSTPAMVRVTTLDPDLVALYAFEEGQGVLANDTSGNAHHADITGASWVSGAVGGALSFDGSDGVATPVLMDAPDSWTYSIWIQPDAENTCTSFEGLVGQQSDPRIAWSHDAAQTCHVASMAATAATNMPQGADGPVIPLGTWHHAAAVFTTGPTSGRQELYLDGVLVAEADTPEALRRPGEAHYIGKLGMDRYFLGLLDEVRIYERALSPEEVAELHRAGLP